MIVGIGTDLVFIPRIQEMLEKYGDKAAEKILTEQEFVSFLKAKQPSAFLAKRFAAKEAAVKALGTGFREGIHLHDFAVTNDRLGKPELHLFGAAEQLRLEKQITQMLLSLSDDGEYATAFVVMA